MAKDRLSPLFHTMGLVLALLGPGCAKPGGAVQCHWLGPMGQLCLGSGTKGPGGELQAWQLFLFPGVSSPSWRWDGGH